MTTSRQYRYLTDFTTVYDFLIDIYERDWRNGVPAPFLEYALSSTWMDKRYLHRNRLWFDDDQVAAFVFTESEPFKIFFSLRPGYESLAEEMVSYAENHMITQNGKQHFILFKGQQALTDVVRNRGYQKTGGHIDLIYDFEQNGPLAFPLPSGYRFVKNAELDQEKILRCLWKGFNHEEEEGPWDAGHMDDAYLLMTAPHYTPQYPAVIEEEKTGDYVCFAGMWWTPQNHLAYMEPLATVPEHRRKGLAAAALSELYRRMKPLGATHMTGGANKFYAKIGYHPLIVWTVWEK